MKRLLAVFLCVMVLSLLGVAAPFAQAEGVCYIVPEGQQVNFIYDERDTESLKDNYVRVTVPYGYTMVVIGDVTGKNISAIYAGKTGLVSNDDLKKMAVSPSEKQLPAIEVKVSTGVSLYRIIDGSRVEVGSVDEATKLYYIGGYVLNSIPYYAVRKENDDTFVYFVLNNDTVQNSIEIEDTLHPRGAIVSAAEGGSSATETPSTKNFTWVRFVLILGIIVPLITIVLMIVRPRARMRRTYREVSDNDDDYDGIDDV